MSAPPSQLSRARVEKSTNSVSAHDNKSQFRGNDNVQEPSSKARVKLPLAASKILSDFINTTPGFWEKFPKGVPDLETRNNLLSQIREVAGARSYKMQQLRTWFIYRWNKRLENAQRENLRSASSASTSTSTLANSTTSTNHTYPSLDRKAISSLAGMCKDIPNPSQDTIAVFANLLGSSKSPVALEDVSRFIHDYHNRPVVSSNHNSGAPVLNFIASSASMSPGPYNIKKRESLSPSVPPESPLMSPQPACNSGDPYASEPERFTRVPSRMHEPNDYPNMTASGSSPSPFPPQQIMAPRGQHTLTEGCLEPRGLSASASLNPLISPSLQAILNGIATARSNAREGTSGTEKYPTTKEELDIMFAPYDATFATIREMLETNKPY